LDRVDYCHAFIPSLSSATFTDTFDLVFAAIAAAVLAAVFAAILATTGWPLCHSALIHLSAMRHRFFDTQ
jgi:uncharacterized membrane protein YfbV (UPF0208 family)